MMRVTTRAIVIALLFGTLFGCSPTQTIKRSQTLATAGTTYTQALEDLVSEDRDRYVDRDSAILLTRMHDRPAAEKKDPDRVAAARHDTLLHSDDRLGPVMNKYDLLLQQLSLEQDYFRALQALADDDANGAAADAAAAASGALNDISGALGKLKTPPLNDAAKTAISGLAGQIGDFIKARALQTALRRDAVIIAEALAWNGDIIGDVGASLDAENKFARKEAYWKSVIDPYTAGEIGDTDVWKTDRRDYVTKRLDEETIAKAKSASEKMRIAWEATLRNKVDTETIQATLTDIQSLAASLEAIRKARQPSTTT